MKIYNYEVYGNSKENSLKKRYEISDNISLFDKITNDNDKKYKFSYIISEYSKKVIYDNYLYEQVLIVIYAKTKLVEWPYDSDRYLNYIEEERTYDSNNCIITDKILTTLG
ncbi:hypothetical protein BCR32DRAFT_288587 [Anaeromyces robustus]|uniref:Uncharacterized protein n=1 Tax=Anaeromyces robustus TaxID=1754192 RepID=A0A1Y1UFZ7_9FUNG|nr:hypothetical protein BCR32DRAFT_288587 [Anaeromyces robustus]|eukprot:ORX36990.1 hypothetical protein BCR32DRAFT_288587 [Anaeromyces robustus]